ncbi:hypothetical protein EDF24_0894 [Curtobacterium sp. PhB130]|nr:hypothetical protein EDF24_0894 [Curtobacterium sp. PhB130]TCK65559.1 hypothetical protein EDF27_0299 [Curtobacterium sp. PhB136]
MNRQGWGSAGQALWDAGPGRDVGTVRTLFEHDRHVAGLSTEDGRAGTLAGAVERLQRRTESSHEPGADWRTTVLAAVWEAHRTRRVAPDDRYVAHRAYPAPRGIFAADAVLEVEDPIGTRQVRFGPLGAGQPSPPEYPWASAHLGFDVDPARYPTPYGGLRATLADLESGHLAATVALCARRAGIPTALLRRTGSDAHASYRLRFLPEGPSEPLLDRCVDTAAAGTASDLRTWLDQRSSGRSSENLVTSGSVTDEQAEAVHRALRAGLELVGEHVPDGGIRLLAHGADPGSIDAVRVVDLGASDSGRTLRGRPRMTSSRGITFVVQPRLLAGLHGSQTHRVIPFLLGWIAQWGCLAAAGIGIASRPARNHDEVEWADALGADPNAVIGYQLWLRTMPVEVQGVPWSTRGIRL